MKEYSLFVSANGDIEAFCGGQFALTAVGRGLAGNVAALWEALAATGERLMELRDTGVDDRSGDRTFMIKTLPVGAMVLPGDAKAEVTPQKTGTTFDLR